LTQFNCITAYLLETETSAKYRLGIRILDAKTHQKHRPPNTDHAQPVHAASYNRGMLFSIAFGASPRLTGQTLQTCAITPKTITTG
jgi:hypothetical protein